MENQSPELNITHTTPAPPLGLVPQSYSTPALLQHQQPSTSSIATTTMTTRNMNGTTAAAAQQKTGPYLRIVEQPAKNDQRFRYVVEGRSAGSIKGVNWTAENPTYPTIEIVNYNKPVVVVVSCVTKDKPYRPHPHKVVGRDGGGQKYKNGICEVTLNEPPLRASFSNLGIQCTKKKDMEDSLKERRSIKVNPFNTKPDKDPKNDYDLHVVRLCFHAFINPTGQAFEPLEPVVTDPIIDKKAITDLVICQLCSCAAKASGGDRKILLCDKVEKNDIRVKFTEYDSQGGVKWFANVECQPQDIHKQYAIAFYTPPYAKTDISAPVTVWIQLERPSDKSLSKPLEFQYIPNPGMRTFTRIRRKIKRKEELDIFKQILSLDSETTATKYSCPAEDGNNDNDETVSSDSSASKPNSSDTLNEYEAAIRRRMCTETEPTEPEDIDDADITRPLDEDIEFEVPQINFPVTDESTQTSTPMEEILKQKQLNAFGDSRPLTAIDKITEWMRSSEFERTDSLTVENGDTLSLSPVTVVTNISACSPNTPNSYANTSTTTDDDKTFTELMEQVDELDDMLSRRNTLEQIAEWDDDSSRRNTLSQITEMTESSRRATLDQVAELGDSLSRRSTLDGSTVKEFPLRATAAPARTASAQPSMELDENFDETATYTSLKIALKNPVDMPTHSKIIEAQRKLFELSTNSASTEEDMTGLVVLTNPPAPRIKVNAVQTPPSPPSPPLPLPPRSPSPGPDQKLPPLPPKRRISHELNVSSNSTPNTSFRRTERNGSLPARPPSQIIIMRSPEQSPTKRQSASPTPTASPRKKQGFFARLFSRKSKGDIKAELPAPILPPPPTQQELEPAAKQKNDSKSTTPMGSREPSIGHFSIADPHRSSVRSAKSLQPNRSPNRSPNLSPHSSTNVSVRSMSGKPVGRSSSSVSGKRPNYLDADVIHIPLKGDGNEQSPTISTFGRQLDRRTLSALQLADIPVCEGNMELVAIADRQSIKNLCEGDFGIVLDPSVDLGEAEHFALYTCVVEHDPQEDEEGMGNGNARAVDVLDSFEAKRKRLQSPKALRQYVQAHGQFPTTSSNPADFGGNLYPLPPTPEFKVERVTSPAYYSNQNSPYSMTHSPSPQSPPAMGAMGTQFVTLTANQNSTNPFLNAANDIRMTTPSKKLPSMSGGFFTPLYADQATNYNIPTTAATVATANVYHNNQPTDSSEMTSEGRLVNRLAAQLQADADSVNNINYVNNISNANNNVNNVAYNFNYNVDMLPMQFNNTTQQPMEEDGPTTSGLIRMLADSDLLQLSNLSVSGNT